VARSSKPEATPSPAAGPASKPVAPRRPIPAEIKTLAAAFDRAEEDLQHGLAKTPDLANAIRAFRAADSPWPAAPNRTAVFALELAIAALRSSNQYAREEGGRLLAEYNARIRQVNGADAFECAWLTTEVVALEGLFMADSAMLFVPRAVERCPNEPRLHLAHAMILEQQWVRRGSPAADEAAVLTGYEDAIKYPDSAAEASVRGAWFLYRTGKTRDALTMIDNARPPAADRYVTYLRDLVRGQVLRASGRSDDAVAAFRTALTTWQGAQSARVALMTLLLSRGDRREAAALAAAIETAPEDQLDPWWTFWLGDYRAYPAIVSKLREMGR
jgi:tetratricopeptide (TPR) repeat protein